LITLTANGPRWSGKTRFVGERLVDPLRWRSPRRIFVDSMSDLFYDGFTDEQIAAVFGVMILAAQHTYQILTKRPARMREWFERWTVEACLDVLVRFQLPNGESVPGAREWNRPPRREWYDVEAWPVPWIWLGTSVENQAAADERVPTLLNTPAVVRFLSIEPLLELVNLRRVRPSPVPIDTLTGGWGVEGNDDAHHKQDPRISWVIGGCESGPGARPCSVAWLRALRDQCAATGVPFFLKQAGDWRAPLSERNGVMTAGDGSKCKGGGVIELPYLDGTQHAAFPVVAT
jgi:protein gp37